MIIKIKKFLKKKTQIYFHTSEAREFLFYISSSQQVDLVEKETYKRFQQQIYNTHATT